ncbi:hypothetical protein [Paenisporosarcina indica]|uniref:hypothetical protein n=1 Tax=Paenisporosarcina indica TaxID=650093 RepID=UPI000A953664|nr:hypothetical protein [Paenisporosarcina indica]
MIAFNGFVMIAANGFASVVQATGDIESMVGSAALLKEGNRGLIDLLIMMGSVHPLEQ